MESPLGSSGGLSGFRVVERTDRPGPYSDDYVIEGADGRRVRHHRPRAMGRPWGILRFPGSDVEMVVAGGRDNTRHEQICCYSASDDTCAWEVLIAPVPAREWSKERLPFFPPFGFWHFLTLRDPASAKALRGIEPAQARALLDAHLAGGSEQVRATLAELLPDVTHERTQEGVLRSVVAAAELRSARARTVERVRRTRAQAPADGDAGADQAGQSE